MNQRGVVASQILHHGGQGRDCPGNAYQARPVCLGREGRRGEMANDFGAHGLDLIGKRRVVEDVAFGQAHRPKGQATTKLDRTPASDDDLGGPAPDVDHHHGLGGSLGKRKPRGQKGQRGLSLAIDDLYRRVQQGRGTTEEVGCVGRPAQRLGADGEDGRFVHARQHRVAGEHGQRSIDSFLT